MKTILQVVQHLSPGGLETMALELKKINDGKARIIIVSLEGTKKEAMKNWARLNEIEADIIYLDKQGGIKLSTILKLVVLFNRIAPDTVHTHHIGPLIYGGIAARLANVPHLVHTEHDAWHLENQKRSLIQRLIVKLTHPILVADAESVARGLAHHLQKSDIAIVRNGVDINYFSPGDKKSSRRKLDLPLNKKIIGCSGRLVEIKGHKIALRALKNLSPDFHLAIAGTGILEEQLKSLAIELEIEHRVHFLGHVENMPIFYRGLDVFCLPSLREGMPLAPLEAQACGIVSVITDTGGSAETLCRKSGILVAPGDPHELSKALKNILQRRVNANPRHFVEKSGNSDVMARAYAELCLIEEDAA